MKNSTPLAGWSFSALGMGKNDQCPMFQVETSPEKI
jgi:hypothetical protein